MNKRLAAIVTVVLFVVLFSCDKTEDKEIISADFSGITETDNQGNVIGKIDNTDWQLDDEWSEKEEAIFNLTSNKTVEQDASYLEDDIIINYAYPNPCDNYVIITFSFSPGTLLQLALVNNDFELIYYYTADYTESLIYVDLSELDLQNNTIYRFYYQFVRPGSTTYKGHGDIKIER